MSTNSTLRAGRIPAWHNHTCNCFLLFCLTLLSICTSQAQECTPFIPCAGPDCPTVYPGTILPNSPPATYNGTDSSFNVIVRGNFTVPNAGGAETEGRVAVGGNFIFEKTYYGVGSSGGGTYVVAPDGSNSLLVRGNIQRSAGAIGTIGNTQTGPPNIATNVLVGGTIAVNISLNGAGILLDNQGVASIEAKVNFDSIFANLDTKSTCYINLPATGTFNGVSNTLVGDNVSSTQVFTLTAANVAALTSQNLLFSGIPVGATIIINVAGTTLNWQVANVAASIPNDPAYNSFFGVGATDPDVDVRKVIFNFYEATSVTLTNTVNGSVLVPNGDLTLTGSLNGRLAVGGNLLHNGDGSEIHNYPFTGEGVCVDCIRPVVSLNTMAQILCQGVAAAPFVATVVSGTVTTSNFYGPLADTTGALGASIGTGLTLTPSDAQLPAPAATAYFALVVQNGQAACSDTVFVSIRVNPKPALTINDTTLCAGQSLDLTALVTGFDTLQSVIFTQGSVTGTVVSAPLAFIPASTTALFVQVATSQGCRDTTQFNVTVNAQPTAGADQTLVCAGIISPTTTSLTATPIGGTWINAAGNPTSANFTPNAAVTLVSGLNAGTYRFVYTLAGCSDTVQVTVPDCQSFCIPPVLSATVAGVQAVCEGALTVTLAATVAGTITESNFFGPLADTTGALGASIGTGLSLALDAGQLPAAGDTAFFALVVNNGPLTCADTVFFGITVNSSLVLTVSDTLVCAGSVLDLTALVSGFDTLLNVSFEAGGIAIDNASAFVADSTVTLTITASNLLGCTDTTQLTLNVAPLLELTTTVTDTLVCAGTVLDLTALVSGFDTLLNVNFEAGGIAIANASAFVADSTVTLTITASNLLGCTDTAQLTVNVAPLLDLTTTVTDTLVCTGSVLDLTALVSGFDTLVNVNFEAGGVAIANASAFVADSTVTLTITASNLLGCSDTTQLTLNVVDCSEPIDLSLNKSVSQKMAMLGDTIIYTLVVRNEGTTNATGVEVTDSLTAGVQYLSSVGTGTFSEVSKIWLIGSLAAGDSASIQIKVKVIAQGVWFNTAQISKTNEPDIDSTPGNNTDGEDDIDRECFTVPVLVCRGQGQGVELSVLAPYTGVVWFRKVQGGEPVQVATGNIYVAVETELGSYEYTFTSTSGTCPAEGCCPILIAVEDCCPAQICVPYTVTKRRK